MNNYKGNVSSSFITKAWDSYIRYRADKEKLHARIKTNMNSYKAAYAALYDENTNNTVPKTAYILSSVENKYADYMDNFPVPNFLPRERSDEEISRVLSKILPVQLDISDFREAYKRDVRQKLISGTGIYGIFYDRDAKEINIRSLDILNVFCDMNVRDVQDSRFLFITEAVDNSTLKRKYPEFSELFEGDVTCEGYEKDKNRSDRSEIIDCYYKKPGSGVHLIKFCREQIIAASEDIPGYEKGLYEHGLYPVIFDVLYPENDSPFGFGIVDTMRNPQLYIDRLDAAILKNALLASSPKWLINRNSGINKEDFADVSREIIEANSVDELHVRRIETGGISNGIMQHRNQKIQELKEVSANRDVSAGGTAAGVTAASAITALQEAGDKQSRAMISDSYDAYKKVVKMVISLMRQFFDEERVFRITNANGVNEYKSFKGTQLIRKTDVCDALGFPVSTRYKNIEFDVDVVPQKQNAFKRENNNQTIISLWNNGFFDPERLEMSMLALPFIHFDGKDAVVSAIGEKLDKIKAAQSMHQSYVNAGGVTNA